MKRPVLIVNFALTFMKITVLQILIAVGISGWTTASPNDSYGQGVLDNTLSISAENEKLIVVLSRIEELVHVKFSYNPKTIPIDKQVSVHLREATLRDVLSDLLEPLTINFEVSGDYIILGKHLVNDVPDSHGSTNTTFQDATALTVSGTVTSEAGETMPGVNVIEKGTTNGTTTDAEGKYSIVISDNNAVLVFSFIGYTIREVAADGRSVIDVSLSEDVQSLDEVVVVGYGTRKKSNLTGSVSSVNVANIDRKRSATQTSQLLAGEVAGLTAREDSGSPGNDGSTLTVRGLGTFSAAGTAPLVIVDGVIQTSINDVNPNDIASISVLKDAASASIYGSRAANGVIIIETEKGKAGVMQVRYESFVGKQSAELPDYLNSWEYAEAYNTALINEGGTASYTQEEIEKFRSGSNPDDYPNSPHVRDLFNTGGALQTKHNLTLSGGLDNIRYLFSSGYLRKNGMIADNYNDRYDILLNVNSKVRDNLRFGASLKVIENLVNEPAYVQQANFLDMGSLISKAVTTPATVPLIRSDGSYGSHMGYPNAKAGLDSDGFRQRTRTTLNSNVSLEWDIINSLKVSGRLGYNFNNNSNKEFAAEYDAGRGQIQGPSSISEEWGRDKYLSLVALVDYDKTIGKHYFHVLGGYSQEVFNDYYLGGYRNDFPTTQLPELDVASPANDNNWGGSSTWKLRSYFGRVNYSFEDKYLLEGNVRYDGSSRFSKGNRFGLFPSFSAAWVVSQENFFDVPWVASLKVRGSFGILGNQQIGTYPYQKVLALGYDFFQGEMVQPGIRLTSLPNQDITWETTEITNGGLDIGLFNGKLSLGIDHYYKRTYDILYGLTVSKVLGMGVGYQNAGEVENRGWDFEVEYRSQVRDLSFNIAPVFSVVRNKVLSLSNVERDVSRGLFVGESLNSYYGYSTDGLFVDQADVDSYPTQNYSAAPGFPRYKDISGPDGVPDGVVTADYDRSVLGSTFPRFSYGLGISLDYKAFDVFIQAQGLGGMSRRIEAKALALYNNGNIERWQWEGRWTEENPDRYAEYPKFISSYNSRSFEDLNDYWLRDATFLRIKDIQVGYNIPQKVLESTFIDQCRIYFSGRNLLTFHSGEKGWDPEMYVSTGYNTSFYPPTKVLGFGVNVTF